MSYITTNELSEGDHILYPGENGDEPCLITNVFAYVSRGMRMITLDLFGDGPHRVHCLADQQWNTLDYLEG